MKLLKSMVTLACLCTVACDQDPARSVKIEGSDPVAPTASPAPTPIDDPAKMAAVVASLPAVSGPIMNGCPPPPEDSVGGSLLTVTGPCAFEHKGTVSCERLVDDFYLTTTRKAAQGTTLTFFVNVEHYNGPGSYKDAQMFVSVMDKKLIYRWSSDTVDITVGPEEAFAVLLTTQLLAEPLLVDCSGPMANYQCGGRGDPTVFTDTYEIVAGTLKCEAGGDKKP